MTAAASPSSTATSAFITALPRSVRMTTPSPASADAIAAAISSGTVPMPP
jgi:hypothetical protein